MLGAEISIARSVKHAEPPSGGFLDAVSFALLEMDHVEVAVGLQPVLVDFYGERAYQPQAALGAGEGPDDEGPPLDLLIEALEHVGGLQVLVVLARQAVEGEGLLDVLLDPVGELGILGLPA